MTKALNTNTRQRIERTMKALTANRMKAHYVEKASDVAALVQKLIPQGATVSTGGSVSLVETGVLDLLSGGQYTFLDRDRVAGAEREALHRQAFSADWYLASSNAVTEQGELYNIDGNGNRVAALTFGPKNVVLVVGCNKLVPDLAAAAQRVREIAAPANTVRLARKTPCTVTGKCDDCRSPERICCTTVIHAQQQIVDRIQVILVGEPLGY